MLCPSWQHLNPWQWRCCCWQPQLTAPWWGWRIRFHELMEGISVHSAFSLAIATKFTTWAMQDYSFPVSLPEEVLFIQIRPVEHLCCPFRAPVTWLGSCTWWSMSLRCHWHTYLGDTSAFHTPGAFMHCPGAATYLDRLPAIWWSKISPFYHIWESKLLRFFFFIILQCLCWKRVAAEKKSLLCRQEYLSSTN